MARVIAKPTKLHGDEVAKFIGIAMNGSDEENFAARIAQMKRERGSVSGAARRAIRRVNQSVDEIDLTLGTQK